ncbi:MAG: fused MFS/spermidine synthase [Gemmatimonadota bacterium]
MRLRLYTAFGLSGGAGLIYELLWSRYLSLWVGHAAYAQVLVIALFLGGMAAGALAVGHRSESLANPLAMYAIAELMLGLVGLLFDPIFRWATGALYEGLFPILAGSRWPGAVRWVAAGLLIFPPSFLLGTTFPLLAAGCLRRLRDPAGRTIATLYFVNSLGGAVGVLVGGFLLVAAVGLPGSLRGAAALNAAAALLALWAARGGEASHEARQPASERAAGRTPPPAPNGRPPGWRLLLGVSALTAVASFAYEVGWIRMLSLVMGSATHSFELMLSAFILGLALGAMAIRGRADCTVEPLRLLGWIQWAMGLTALATLPVYLKTFDLMAWLLGMLEPTGGGYRLFAVGRYGIGLLVMLPSAFLAGTTLPLITSTLLRRGAGEAAIGRVYGWNTLGSITGVAVAGLLLLPWLGLKGLITAGALLDISLGLVLLWRSGGEASSSAPSPARSFLTSSRVSAAAAALVAALSVAAVSRGMQFDHTLLTSGVFRWGELPEAGERPVLYYRDGRTASVGAYVTGADTLIVLASNGKADASLTARWIRAASEPVPPEPIYQQDEATQLLSPLVALAHTPGARSAAVIGHGSGITTHYLLGSPRLEQVVTVEIEPRIIDASLVYYPANRRAFDDPRSRFVIDDARAYFAYRKQPLDLIVSEPSNPWVSGTSSLFTLEFYRKARGQLSPNGVFAQWFHLYESDDTLVLSVLAAIHAAFGDYRGYLVGRTDLLVIATPASRLPAPEWSVLRWPRIRADIAHLLPFRPEALAALELFRRKEMAPLLASWRAPNTDFRPVLDSRAEELRYRDAFATGTYALATEPLNLAAALGGRARGFASYAAAPVQSLAPMERTSLSAWLREATDNDGGAQRGQPYGTELLRYRRLLRSLGSSAPRDWRAWVREAAHVEEAIHGPAAGVVDTAFYGRLRRALDRWEAPREVRAAVEFLRALRGREFEAVAAVAPLLTSEAHTTGAWIDAGLLLDGAVVSYLRTGRPELARSAFSSLAPVAGRDPSDLRNQLLLAHIRAAERRVDPQEP